jgi:Ca2+-binding RTX toxin-like protein
MASRAVGLGAWLAAVVVAVGCTGDADTQTDPDPRTSAAAPAVVDETPAPTGRPTPKKGEPGFEELPTCHGRRHATILGTGGDDTIVATPADDVIVTFGGADRISHLRDDDQVCAGPGDDTVTDVHGWQGTVDLGSGDDRLSVVRGTGSVIGGSGADRIGLPIQPIAVDPGPGDDTIRVVPSGPPHFPSNIAYNSPCVTYRAAPRPVRIDLRGGWTRGLGRDRLLNVHCVQGSRFGDAIVGSPYADDIEVGGGADEIWSLGGDDFVRDESYPGVGDIFYLGAGDDLAMPGGGPDRIYGEGGDDVVEAGEGADYLEGGEGDDELLAAYRCEGDNSGGSGMVDELPNEVFGGPGDDTLTGDLGNDRIDGGSGFDTADGGHQDGRVDWFESIEQTMVCQTSF